MQLITSAYANSVAVFDFSLLILSYSLCKDGMITGEKNRAQNYLTVSNLKLDDVFSDVFGKSSLSITEQILSHPGETFDVTLFLTDGARLRWKKSRLPLMGPFLLNRLSNSASAWITWMN